MNQKTATNSIERMRAAARADRPPPATPVPSGERRIRYSLLLEPGLHKGIRRYALEREVDVSVVVRALVELLLEEDEALRWQIDARIAGIRRT